MKEHMSITISKDTLARLKRYALREHRPVSQVVEMAIEKLLREKMSDSDKIVTTKGSFQGSFSREETYADR